MLATDNIISLEAHKHRLRVSFYLALLAESVLHAYNDNSSTANRIIKAEFVRHPLPADFIPSPDSVVAMKRIDLETIFETVRVLRIMGDKTLLDPFNQRREVSPN